VNSALEVRKDKVMRYWIISCSVLMGSISLFRTGDLGRIIASLAIGAGIGIVLYGLYIALTSAVSSVGNLSVIRSVKMNKFIWLIVFFVAVIVQATQSNFMFALGSSIPWFIAGMVFSPIWWGVTKKKRNSSWQWFDWLNAGAYIMIILLVLSVVVKAYISSQGVG
jgi:hypothetical protein